MIAALRGKVIHFEGMMVTVELASGIAYEVNVNASCLASLQLNEPCFLYTHFIVREDAQLLFGFADLQSRSLFKEMIKVNGIGPKVAMSILSAMSVDDFVQAIMGENVKALCLVPGIGKKTAERIVVEMKDKVAKFNLAQGSQVVDLEPTASSAVLDETASALVGLGYKEADALKAIKQVYIAPMDTRELIVACLAQLNRNK